MLECVYVCLGVGRTLQAGQLTDGEKRNGKQHAMHLGLASLRYFFDS